ncbi:MAG: TRAP transporter substrate-binding protein DctP [Deltaproteobacteria bacterium]|nr:TRAP transporter substrate-binding protein DctP [Deltaproteobacteria bacterium]
MKKGRFVLATGLIVLLVLGMTGLSLAAEQAKFKLRLQSHLIPDDAKRGLNRYAEAVKAMSGGAIEISIFGAGAIVPVKETLQAAGTGTLDIVMYPEGFWYKTIPVSWVGMGIPFVFRDLEEAKYFMLKKGYLELLREGYAKHNVHVIPYEPFSIGLMTKQPVNKAEDLKGMKLRAYGTMADWLGKLGASTVVIPGGELYTALATGVVSGAHWGDAGPMYIMKFHEVLKNYMRPEPAIGSWNNLIVNADLWKKFTPEQKAIMETTGIGCGLMASNETRVICTKSLNDMVNNWQVKVNIPSEEELEKMRKPSLELQEHMAATKDPLTVKAMGLLRDYMKELGYEK